MNIENKTYNGFKNYETWNVALWIQNDEGLYRMAKRAKNYSQFTKELKDAYSYFTSDKLNAIGRITPDNVSWTDPELDIEALDKLLEDL